MSGSLRAHLVVRRSTGFELDAEFLALEFGNDKNTPIAPVNTRSAVEIPSRHSKSYLAVVSTPTKPLTACESVRESVRV